MKKGQAWMFDLIVASVIFITGIVLFYIYSLNLSNETEDIISLMNYEGNTLADSILGEGVPINWNIVDVQKIGLVSSSKINETKLELFYNISILNYEKTRALFAISDNYYVFFDFPIIINSIPVEGIGKKPINPRNLIKVTRVTIYRGEPVAISIDIWE